MNESQPQPGEFLDLNVEMSNTQFDPKEFSILSETAPVVHHKAWEIIDSTKMSDARRCLRRFMLAHIFGWKPAVESNHLTFGRAWHKAKEYLRIHGCNANTIEEAYQQFEAVYRAEYPPETDTDFGAKTPGNAFLALAQYASKYGNELEQTLYTEIADWVPVSQTRNLAFKIDAIKINQLQQKLFVDDKTGSELSKRWTDQWALSSQMSAYYHVMRMLWPKEEVVPGYVDGAIFRKKGNDFPRIPIHRSDEMLDAWLWNTNWYWDQIAFSLDDLINKCRPSDPVLYTFPTDEEGCQKYNGCEFFDLCANIPNPLDFYNIESYIKGSPEAPPGFKVEFWNPFEEFPEAKPLSTFGLELGLERR